MKKKLVLKPFVLPTLYILMVIVLMTMSTTLIYKEKEEDDDLTYVSDSIIDDSTPVVNDSQIIILKPFTSENVTVVSGYYDYQAEAANQESSIVKYENTYLQNSGITYSSTEEFDVVSIMDGTITKIYSNDLLGNIIEITHDKDFVSVYLSSDKVHPSNSCTGSSTVILTIISLFVIAFSLYCTSATGDILSISVNIPSLNFNLFFSFLFIFFSLNIFILIPPFYFLYF